MNTDEIVRALYLCAAGGQTTLQTSEWCAKAADLIGSLQAQHEQAALNYQQKCRDVTELEAQLTASHRREKAAVEDIYKMTDGGECDICKHYNHDKNTCAQPDVHYDECFEWRGPQEAGEGVNDNG